MSVRLDERAAEFRAQLERMLEEPVPVLGRAQLDAMALFRYCVLFDELPDEVSEGGFVPREERE